MPFSIALAISLAAVLAAPRDSVPPDSVRADPEIRLTVLRNASDVRRCYEREGLRRDPTVRGLVELAVTILPTGLVASVTVQSSSLVGPATRDVTSCIAVAARTWRFERGPFAVTTVVLPFLLVPQSSESPLASALSRSG